MKKRNWAFLFLGFISVVLLNGAKVDCNIFAPPVIVDDDEDCISLCDVDDDECIALCEDD